MTEFDSLFRSVWIGEAPAEALADWLREKFDAYPDNVYEAVYKFADLEEELPKRAILIVWWTPIRQMNCIFQVPYFGMRNTEVFRDPDVGSDFPKWLTGQIDFLYYVLSK